MNPPVTNIVVELKRNAKTEKAEWWNRYLKGAIQFVGLGIPEIRKILLDLNKDQQLDQMSMNRQVGLVNGLIKGRFAEQKLAAILYIQLFWLGKQKNTFLLSLISDWFDERLIFDWNTTDWLSVKILTPMIDSGDDNVIWTLKRWSRDPYLWKARASLVSFAQAKSIVDHARVIENSSHFLICREERFAKTAVAWVMREYSKHDAEFVLSFLSKHVKYTTAEVKRNALKHYRQTLRSDRNHKIT